MNEPGKALCSLCNKDLVCGTRGAITIVDHLKRRSHVEKYIINKTNYALPNQACLKSTYGLHPMYQEFVMPEKTLPVTTNIPLCDRVSHMEGMVLSFVAEYSFPFSSPKNIVELCKEMMRNPKIDNKLQVARTTASYKMRNGLARGLEKQLVDKLKEGFFSFNIDEATSPTLHKVLTLLVFYFCSTKNEVVDEHLGSLNLPTVNSETVFKAVVNLMDEKNLPYSNLMAVLMNSCSVMRGSKNGFEVKLRENVASHLIDIDVDACHHIIMPLRNLQRSLTNI